MGFVIIGRERGYSASPQARFSKYGRISFNKAAASILEKEAVENVLLLWDEGTRRVGIRRIAKKDSRAFHVGYDKNKYGAAIQAKVFFDAVGFNRSESKTCLAEWDADEGMFVIQLPPECVTKSRKEPSAQMESGKRARMA